MITAFVLFLWTLLKLSLGLLKLLAKLGARMARASFRYAVQVAQSRLFWKSAGYAAFAAMVAGLLIFIGAHPILRDVLTVMGGGSLLAGAGVVYFVRLRRHGSIDGPAWTPSEMTTEEDPTAVSSSVSESSS